MNNPSASVDLQLVPPTERSDSPTKRLKKAPDDDMSELIQVALKTALDSALAPLKSDLQEVLSQTVQHDKRLEAIAQTVVAQGCRLSELEDRCHGRLDAMGAAIQEVQKDQAALRLTVGASGSAPQELEAK